MNPPNKFTLEKAQKKLDKYNLTILSNKWITSKSFYTFKCNNCGNIFNKIFENIFRQKHNCRKCFFINLSKQYSYSFKKLKTLMPNNLTILSQESEYKNAKSSLEFHCNMCDGIFRTRVDNVYRRINKKYFCPLCKIKRTIAKTTYTKDYYLSRLLSINPNIEFIDDKYINTSTKHLFRCKKCNYQWYAQAGRMIRINKSKNNIVNGCPKCCLKQRSNKENAIFEFITNKIPYKVQNNIKIIPNLLNPNSKFEIDIFIPSLKIGFEFDGTYWHSTKALKRRIGMSSSKYHKLKDLSALSIGIKLFHIKEENYDKNKEAVLNTILEIVDKHSSLF